MATVIGFGGKRQDSPMANRDGGARRTRGLGEVLSLGVIPRLLMTNARPALEPEQAEALIRQSDIETLAPVAIDEAAHVLLDRVEAIMRRGVSAEEVFVELLAPIARWLGREWEEDRLDFVAVSMGLWRLQEVLRQVAANTSRATTNRQKRALFSPMPGDQHSFGAAMVQECFEIAGWDSELLCEPTQGQLIDMVAGRSFDLLGLTLTCDCATERLTALLRAVRSVSANPDIRIMIGGRLPTECPNLAALAGADGTARSAVAAVRLADRLVGTLRMAASA